MFKKKLKVESEYSKKEDIPVKIQKIYNKEKKSALPCPYHIKKPQRHCIDCDGIRKSNSQ